MIWLDNNRQYYLGSAPFVKSAGEETTTLDPEARRECEDIMDKIYRENPSYFPYGLSIQGHKAASGDVYMIRQASTKKAIGFTGWQQFKEGHRKIGYYSIGILPEHRQQGYAKEAVKEILRIKSAGVDEVRAYILRHNTPSINLARRLHIPIDHDK